MPGLLRRGAATGPGGTGLLRGIADIAPEPHETDAGRDPEPTSPGLMGWESRGLSVTLVVRRVPSCRCAITSARRSPTEGRGRAFTAVAGHDRRGLNRKLPDATSPSRRSTWARPSRSMWRPTTRTTPIPHPPARAATAAGSRPRSGPRRGRRWPSRPTCRPWTSTRCASTTPGRAAGSWRPSRSSARPTRTGPSTVALRHQVRGPAPEPGLRRDRRPRHDPHVNLYGDLMELFGQTDPSLADGPPRSTPPPAAGRETAMPGCWRPGRIPWRSATAADAAALAHREPRRAARPGSELRGDLPHPPHFVDRG